jgi:hypothetical protein
VLLAVTLSGASSSFVYLEGELVATVDGSEQLLSSGTEDFFLSAQYFDLGTFTTPLSGCTALDRDASTFTAFKLFEEDPVVWHANFSLVWNLGDTSWPGNATTVTSLTWAYVW